MHIGFATLHRPGTVVLDMSHQHVIHTMWLIHIIIHVDLGGGVVDVQLEDIIQRNLSVTFILYS